MSPHLSAVGRRRAALPALCALSHKNGNTTVLRRFMFRLSRRPLFPVTSYVFCLCSRSKTSLSTPRSGFVSSFKANVLRFENNPSEAT
ncbi:hypothetical protein EVAR_48785_1 [Eumeta japonica]|uniref:Uncharacterized protein n=1 Tax=Eumeta variegata TaxID=151549 RepID=A0A4C1Y5D9_EUMVA|nr:hypothetical protein EVAR_48785_1 [Eumeta japonica]